MYQAVNVRRMMAILILYIKWYLIKMNHCMKLILNHLQVYIKLSGWFSYAYKDKHLLSVILENKNGWKVINKLSDLSVLYYREISKAQSNISLSTEIHMKGTFPRFCFLHDQSSSWVYHNLYGILHSFLMRNSSEFRSAQKVPRYFD